MTMIAPMFNLYFLLLLNSISTTTIRSKPTDNQHECTTFFHSNDCYFFPCLDARYQCGPNSHLVRFSYDFCLLTTETSHFQLTKRAQQFFNQTNLCVMKQLLDSLGDERIFSRSTCTTVQSIVFRHYLYCFQSNQRIEERNDDERALTNAPSFCSIICDDLETIINLFLNLSLQYVNLYELLIETAKSCGTQMNLEIRRTLPAILISICLDRNHVQLKNDVSKIMLNPRYVHDRTYKE